MQPPSQTIRRNRDAPEMKFAGQTNADGEKSNRRKANMKPLTALAFLYLKTPRPALLFALKDVGYGDVSQPGAEIAPQLGEYGIQSSGDGTTW